MHESDVVVLGSGAAALTAALTAAVGGASVTVLERASVFGGTSAVSGGAMWLPGSGLDPDYTEDLAGAKRYLQKLTVGLIPEAVLDRFLAVAGTVPGFLAEHSPLTFTADVGRPDYHAPWDGSSVTSRSVFANMYELPRLGELRKKVRQPGPGGILPIQHSEERELAGKGENAINELIKERLEKGVAMRGLALIGGLLEGCRDAGVELVSDTRARELIVEDGRVVGVVAERDGERVEYRARRGVVLASGGFEWNRRLWKDFMATPWETPASPPHNEGDGLIMAAKAGAQLANLDKATFIQARKWGEHYDGNEYIRMGGYGALPGEIMVNRSGRRFTNESLNYNDIGRVMTHFDPHTYEYDNYPAYAIGDKAGIGRASTRPVQVGEHGTVEGEFIGEADGWVQGDTLREVAEQLGIDADALEQTVADWNEGAVNGIDPVYHRGEKPWETHWVPGHQTVAPILESPFYAYRVRPSVFGTRGGPVIDQDARVLGWDDQPIPGLFGAGNVVAHPFASAYPGGGGTLGPCVTFGYIAGKVINGASI